LKGLTYYKDSLVKFIFIYNLKDSFQKLNKSIEINEFDTKLLEQNLIFYLTFLNRIVSSSNTTDLKSNDSKTFINTMNTIFNYIDLCQISFSMPNYFTLYDNSFMKKIDFSLLVTKSSNQSSIRLEFFDFVQSMILRLAFIIDSSSMIYYLFDNLTLNVHKLNSLRIKMSHDLLIEQIKLNLSTQNEQSSLKSLKFLSNIYDTMFNSCSCGDSATSLYFIWSVLLNVFSHLNTNLNEKKFKTIVTSLEDFYIKNKLFACYVLFFTSSGSHSFSEFLSETKAFSQVFLLNLFRALSEFYSSEFIKPNQVNQINFLLNLFKKIELESLQSLKSYSSVLSEPLNKLTLSMREYLSKKFKDESNWTSASANSNKLLLNTIFMFSQLCSSLNLVSEIDFLLAFFTKNYQKLPTSLKFNMVYFLYLLLVNKSASTSYDQSINAKIVDLICLVVINDSKTSNEYLKIFCLECLNDADLITASKNTSSITTFPSTILCQLSKKNKQVNEYIMNYLFEFKINTTNGSLEESQFYQDRFSRLVQIYNSNFKSCSKSSRMPKSKVTPLDDTMSILMDVTLSSRENCDSNDSNYDQDNAQKEENENGIDDDDDDDEELDEQAVQDHYEKLEHFEKELISIFDFYSNKNKLMSDKLRSKFKEIVETVSNSL
jgi:hypothetical protein